MHAVAERPRTAVDAPVPAERVRSRVHIEGIVQGVGFRPFVHALALREELTGFVTNDRRGVSIEVEGRPARVDAFADRPDKGGR